MMNIGKKLTFFFSISLENVEEALSDSIMPIPSVEISFFGNVLSCYIERLIDVVQYGREMQDLQKRWLTSRSSFFH